MRIVGAAINEAAVDPSRYERIEYFIDQQGKWLPKPILPEPGAHFASLPGSVDDEDEEDAAAPTVADPAPDGPPTRTVPPR